MAKAPSSLVLYTAVAIGIGAMITLNQMSQKMHPKTDEEQQTEAQEAAAEAAKKNPTATPSAAAADEGPTDDLASLGQDTTRGATSSAAPEVTVRWSWTPQVQNDPSKVYAGVKSLLSAVPQARIHIVNTDETPGVTNGVFVGATQVAAAGPDGSINVDPSAVEKALPK